MGTPRLHRPGLALVVVVGVLVGGVACGAQPASPNLPTPDTTTSTELPEASEEPTAPSRVLLIGDSYSEGYGLAVDESPWEDFVADRLGWSLAIDAVGGTGFVTAKGTDGSTGASYRERLRDHALGSVPDVVVLQGGLNDYLYDADLVAMGVEATVETAKAQWPGVRVVVFGPVAPTGQEARRTAPLREPIRAAAVAAGADYIGPTDEDHWILAADDEVYGLGDGLHLSEEGQRFLARRFVDQWMRLDVSSSTAAPTAEPAG